MEPPQPKRTVASEILEFEDEEARFERIQSALKHLNTSGSSSSSYAPEQSFPQFPKPESKPGPVEPPTELLSRLKAFLPQMEAANAELSKHDPGSLDIENISPDQPHVIEMRLGLGVFEQQQPGRGDSEMVSSSDDTDTSSAESASTSSSDDDSDYDSDSSVEIVVEQALNRPIRPLPRRTRVHIEVLSSTDIPSHQNDNQPAV